MQRQEVKGQTDYITLALIYIKLLMNTMLFNTINSVFSFFPYNFKYTMQCEV